MTMTVTNLSDIIYVIKLGDDYYSSTDAIIDDWPAVRPWLQGVDGISQQIDLTNRTTTTENISVSLADKDNYFRDLLVSGTLKNLTLIVYATIAGETIGNSVILFDGFVDRWSGLSVLTIQARSRLSLLDQYPYPETTYLRITCTATDNGKTDEEAHPATMSIEQGEGSIPAYMNLSLADGTEYQIDISSTITLGDLVDDINTTSVGNFTATAIASTALLGTKLYWRSYDLSSEFNESFLYPAVDVLGGRIELTGHPYDIARDILNGWNSGEGIDYPAAYLNEASFNSDNDGNMRRKWWFRRVLNEQLTARDLLESICESTACYISEIDRELTLVIYRGYIPFESVATITDDMISYQSLEMDWQPETLINQVIINYNVIDNQANSTFTYDDLVSQSDQGEIALQEIESPWITDNVAAGQYPGSTVVNWLAQEICAWQRKPVIEINLDVNWRALSIFVGQYVFLTFGRGATAGWTEKRCLVLEKSFKDDGILLVLAETDRLKWAVIADDSLRGVHYDDATEEERKYLVLRTTESEEGATYVA